MYLQERITVILLEAAQCSMLHLGKVKVPGKTSGRYLLLDVDPKRIVKLTQRAATAYHFFHMSEMIRILTRRRRFHQILNFDNDRKLESSSSSS